MMIVDFLSCNLLALFSYGSLSLHQFISGTRGGLCGLKENKKNGFNILGNSLYLIALGRKISLIMARLNYQKVQKKVFSSVKLIAQKLKFLI